MKNHRLEVKLRHGLVPSSTKILCQSGRCRPRKSPPHWGHWSPGATASRNHERPILETELLRMPVLRQAMKTSSPSKKSRFGCVFSRAGFGRIQMATGSRIFLRSRRQIHQIPARRCSTGNRTMADSTCGRLISIFVNWTGTCPGKDARTVGWKRPVS